jgi:hypothetical protein
VNNLEKHAWREFKAAGWLDNIGKFTDSMQEAICKHVLKLLSTFDKEGHSGTSAPYAIELFTKLAMFKPICPLTGADDEWQEVGNGVYQNTRCSTVFKENNLAYDIDGIVFWEWFRDPDTGEVFKTYFTSYESRVKVEFPYTKPKQPEYRFRPTEQFPFENLAKTADEIKRTFGIKP